MAAQPGAAAARRPYTCSTVPGIVQRRGGPLHYVPCTGKVVALTIDDGPDPRWTPQILALLRRYQIPATFCMVGQRAAAHPDLVRAIVGDGHDIANHTYTHPLNLPWLGWSRIVAEIERGSDAIVAAGGERPKLFRAPGGRWSSQILSCCTRNGMKPLDWSVDPRDWSRPGVRQIVDRILSQTRPGSIILDHDGGGDRSQTVAALRIVLPRLIDAGYTFRQPLAAPARA